MPYQEQWAANLNNSMQKLFSDGSNNRDSILRAHQQASTMQKNSVEAAFKQQEADKAQREDAAKMRYLQTLTPDQQSLLGGVKDPNDFAKVLLNAATYDPRFALSERQTQANSAIVSGQPSMSPYVVDSQIQGRDIANQQNMLKLQGSLALRDTLNSASPGVGDAYSADGQNAIRAMAGMVAPNDPRYITASGGTASNFAPVIAQQPAMNQNAMDVANQQVQIAQQKAAEGGAAKSGSLTATEARNSAFATSLQASMGPLFSIVNYDPVTGEQGDFSIPFTQNAIMANTDPNTKSMLSTELQRTQLDPKWQILRNTGVTIFENILKFMTGAASGSKEDARYQNMFVPTRIDDAEAVREKMDSLVVVQQAIQNGSGVTAQEGLSSADAVRALQTNISYLNSARWAKTPAALDSVYDQATRFYGGEDKIPERLLYRLAEARQKMGE